MKAESAAIYAAAAVLVAALGGVFFMATSETMQGRFVAKCEEQMLARLKAPSTYQRVELVGPRFREATATDLLAVTGDVRESLLDAAADVTGNDRTFHSDKLGFVYFRFTYDAANDYGTPIRGEFVCEQRVYAQKALTDDGWPIIRTDGG